MCNICGRRSRSHVPMRKTKLPRIFSAHFLELQGFLQNKRLWTELIAKVSSQEWGYMNLLESRTLQVRFVINPRSTSERPVSNVIMHCKTQPLLPNGAVLRLHTNPAQPKPQFEKLPKVAFWTLKEKVERPTQWLDVTLGNTSNEPLGNRLRNSQTPPNRNTTKRRLLRRMPSLARSPWNNRVGGYDASHFTITDPKFRNGVCPSFVSKATWPMDAVQRPAFVQPWPLVDTAQLPLRWSALCGMSIARKKKKVTAGYMGRFPGKSGMVWEWFYNDELDGDG